MCMNTSTGFEVRRLMAKAFKGVLSPAQQQQIKKELDKDAKLVYNIGLSPNKVCSACFLLILCQYTYILDFSV